MSRSPCGLPCQPAGDLLFSRRLWGSFGMGMTVRFRRLCNGEVPHKNHRSNQQKSDKSRKGDSGTTTHAQFVLNGTHLSTLSRARYPNDTQLKAESQQVRQNTVTRSTTDRRRRSD